MIKPRNLLLLLVLSAFLAGPAVAGAVDDPATSSSVPTTTETESAPLTLDQDAIDALQEQAGEADDDKSTFEKASDFVTDNAPWFIIGIIVLAAIVAGILIMRGRPRKKGPGTPKASKSNKAMRKAGGTGDAPADVPSASELRRRKRAAIQRSREEERLRRKAEIENRKAARRGQPPVVPVPPAGSPAATPGAIDPVEAEKQGARDQEIAAGAVARFDAPAAPSAPVAAPPAQAVPAPVSPSQTAPAAGVVTPGTGQSEGAYQPEEAYQPEDTYQPYEPETGYASEPSGQEGFAPEAQNFGEPGAEADTSVIHEPSLENPGPDATVGNAARDFLAGSAAGAAGGLAAARGSRGESGDEPDFQDPQAMPEPGMAAEHALVDPEPVTEPEPEPELSPGPEPAPEPEPAPAHGPDATDAAEAEERLRAKVAELKASQQPGPVVPPEPARELPSEPAPLGPDADLSPGLAAVERRLSENSEERDRALRDAEERLRRVEQRAEDAERRAAFAERLAQLKVEESEREKRLNDVVSGIDRAEQRAREAEARAEAAERAAAAALERNDLRTSPSVAPEGEPEQLEPENEPAPEAPVETGRERRVPFREASPASSASSDAVNLNSATFEELREAGLSVTQATRILAYRERFGGYGSVDDLEKVPGFPADLIASLREKLTI